MYFEIIYRAKPIRKYLNGALRNLKRHFDTNLNFYKYYRTDNSYLDEKLFVRNGKNIYCDGGAEVIDELLKQHLIGAEIPVLLRSGARLFKRWQA